MSSALDPDPAGDSHAAARSTTSRTASSRTSAGVKAESLRAMNLSLVLRHVVSAPGVASRASIAAQTGITRATVSRLVDELVQSDLVREVGPTQKAARGRPAMRLAPCAGEIVALGLEVNVSYVAAAVIDLAGTVLARATRSGDFAHSDQQATLGALAELGDGVLRDAGVASAPEERVAAGPQLAGAGLALPGLVSHEAVAVAPNLGWRDVPLDELLRPLAALDPVLVANEADLAAFAVSTPRPGAPDGPAAFIYVSGEVGLGAGIVIEHRLLAGAHGWAGEIGHICADPSGPLCSCGATGCLEAYLGLRALARRAGLPEEATPAEVVAAARAGSDAAARAVQEAGAALGRVLAGVINTVDIPEVLIGGTVAEIGADLLGPARAELRRRVLQSTWTEEQIQIVPSSSDLAVTGAAHRVLQRVVDDPIAWTL